MKTWKKCIAANHRLAVLVTRTCTKHAHARTDLYDVWKAKVTYGHLDRVDGVQVTHPFLLRSTNGDTTWRFCICRRADSLSSLCIWTANPDINTRKWDTTSKLDVLFKKDPGDDNAWKLYIVLKPDARYMLINKQMKGEFEAWLAECAIFKTPKTDPVYYNARGYSYTF